MVKEHQANLKWCPFGRIGNIPHQVAVNDPQLHGYLGAEYASNCIGSQCMAWRYATGTDFDGKTSTGYAKGDGSGYCGLAGVPEVRS